jgi:hypothetical protein
MNPGTKATSTGCLGKAVYRRETERESCLSCWLAMVVARENRTACREGLRSFPAERTLSAGGCYPGEFVELLQGLAFGQGR